MSYSVNKLKTTAECDVAISLATDKKDDLVFEQTVLSRELGGQLKSAALAEANLISVKAQITGFETAIENLPEGKDKKDMAAKIRRLNDRRENLEESIEKSGNVGVLDAELTAMLLAKQIEEVDIYIGEVSDRKAAI